MFSPYFYVCRTNKDISSLLYCNLCLLSFFLFSFTVTFIFLFLFFFLLSKTMGCFSWWLMSSASIQKWFCGIYSAFKCSFDEFVGEKVVSPSYSSTILGPPCLISFLEKWYRFLNCFDFLEILILMVVDTFFFGLYWVFITDHGLSFFVVSWGCCLFLEDWLWSSRHPRPGEGRRAAFGKRFLLGHVRHKFPFGVQGIRRSVGFRWNREGFQAVRERTDVYRREGLNANGLQQIQVRVLERLELGRPVLRA